MCNEVVLKDEFSKLDMGKYQELITKHKKQLDRFLIGPLKNTDRISFECCEVIKGVLDFKL